MPSLALRGSLHRSIAEHQAIVEAIKAHNTEQAIHLISEHIRVPLQSLQNGAECEPLLVREA